MYLSSTKVTVRVELGLSRMTQFGQFLPDVTGCFMAMNMAE